VLCDRFLDIPLAYAIKIRRRRMRGKNRKQNVILSVVEGRIDFLPIGDYKIHIDASYVENGSITFKGRVLDTIQDRKEPDNGRARSF
jgi:hypothetical protein